MQMIAGIIIAVIAIAIIVAVILLYNNLITLRNRVDNAWAQIDVQLQRRNDLIPNLVETVKGYAKHESTVFEEVTAARSASANASGVAETAAAENMIAGALRSLFAVAEAYPDLKANTNFLELQRQLSETEDKISYMRQSYNDTVMRFNIAIETFPGNLIAGGGRFTKRDMLDIPEETRVAPTVSF